MSDQPEHSDWLEKAWRFAHVLTGCTEGAARTFGETLEEVRRHPHGDDEDRVASLFFTILRRRCLKYPARNELPGNAGVLHGLIEPGRSALTLLCLNALPAREIQRVLDIDVRKLADALEKARLALRTQPA
jgi:DNA-directed RNA polymerase specialized sigma24 family protein